MSGTRRLSQNQFIGNRIDLPLKMVEGAQYISVDTKELFIYDSLEDPVLIADTNSYDHDKSRVFLSLTNINSADSDHPTELEVKAWNDGLVSPYSNVVGYYTGDDSVISSTNNAFFIDKDFNVTELGGKVNSKWTDSSVVGSINRPTGNVGIGINTPTQKLEVDGSVKASSFIKDSGTSAEFLMADGSVSTAAAKQWDEIVTGTGTDLSYSSGKVGVGLSPVFALDTLTDSVVLGRLSSTSTKAGLSIQEADDGGYLSTESGRICIGPSIGVSTSNLNFTLDTARLGLGTSSPAQKIHVSGGTIKVDETNVENNESRGLDIDINKENTDGSGFASNVYGIKSYSKANSTETVLNIAGTWSKAEHTGSGQIYYVTGATNRAYHNGSGNSTSVVATFSEARITGTGAGSHTYLIGQNNVAKLDNPNASVQFMQGMHCTVELKEGTVSDNLTVLLLDADYTGSGTLEGDFDYLTIMDDILPTAPGTKRGINSLTLLPSVFAGSIESSQLIVSGGTSSEFMMANGSKAEANSLNLVTSLLTSEPTGSDAVLNIVSLTQAEYDAGSPVATTVYVITDA
tara:strand:+ start:555 stop:2273 length:1719 start_codon:yes stop_codon:yes gene_type:complete